MFRLQKDRQLEGITKLLRIGIKMMSSMAVSRKQIRLEVQEQRQKLKLLNRKVDRLVTAIERLGHNGNRP